MKSLFSSILILVVCFSALAQTDKEFWFVAPEVSIHNNNFDRPVVFRISTTNLPSWVTIAQPANSSFSAQVVNVPANSTITVDLTPYINMVENKPANTILNYGFQITATNPVSVYYEVVSSFCTCNPEMFSLKGKNALGTDFYVPFQNFWNNETSYTPTPNSAFDIVATENNTNVTITPKNDIVGHSANIPFSITLNRGQTYSATATSQSAAMHLHGSRVISDKPIAITIKDDLVRNTVNCSGGADLMGDQIVPVNIVGTTYIIMKGALNGEKIFVLATQDNTSLFVNGNVTPVATINAGDTYMYDINAATYLVSSFPVYVLHASGFGCEIGGALLPPIECTGSHQIGFTRSLDQAFFLNLMVKNGSQGDFILNGNPALILPSAFSVVPGTGGVWVSAQIAFDVLQVPVGVGNIILNTTALFHMGIIHGNNIPGQGGCRYGYFSDFSGLNLGNDNISICSGDSVILDAGIGKDSYLWSNGSTTQTIVVKNTGDYWVDVTVGNCSLSDTVSVIINSGNAVNLGPTSSICTGSSITLDAGSGFSGYLWSDGSGNQTLTVTTAGTYAVTVTDPNGCSSTSEIIITQTPNLILTPTVINESCSGAEDGSIQISESGGSAPFVYSWSNGTSVNPNTGLAAAQYSVTVTDANGCSGTATVDVNIDNALTVTTTSVATTCGDDNGSATASVSGSTGTINYAWSNGALTSTISSVAAGNYSVTASDPSGCSGTATVTITANPDLSVAIQTIPAYCGMNNGTAEANVSDAIGPITYLWSNGNSTNNISNLAPGNYTVTVTDSAGCTAIASAAITTDNIMPVMVNSTPSTCGDDNGTATASVTGVPNVVYSWSSGASGSSISNLSPGSYSVTADNGSGCTGTASVIIDDLQFSIDTVVENSTCELSNGSIEIIPSPAGNYIYTWNTGDSSALLENLATGAYSVVVTDANSCTVTDTFNLSTTPALALDYEVVSDTCGKNLGEITIEVVSGTNPFTYVWQHNIALNSSTATGLDDGVFIVTVTDAFNCTASEEFLLECIIPAPPNTYVFIPNAITINRDEHNETFRVYGHGIADVEIEIWNRWGEKIYASTGATSGWDGTYKGKKVNPGVFVYVVNVFFVDGETKFFSGSLTVIE